MICSTARFKIPYRPCVHCLTVRNYERGFIISLHVKILVGLSHTPFREAAKKRFSLNCRAIKEKNNFFLNLFFQRSKISTAIKLEVGRSVWPGH